MSMFRKLAFTALAAAAVIGASLIAPTSASAFGGFHGNGAGHGGGINNNAGFHPGGNGFHPGGNGCHPGGGCNPRPCFGCWHPHPHPHWQAHYRRPIWYGATPVAYVAAPVAAPVAATCNCLTKQYTPEGAVVFKDLCTNEAAINPPAEAPQQTGMIQPQQ